MNPRKPQSGLEYSSYDNDFSASLVFSMPLYCAPEDLLFRQTEILLEQSKRSYYQRGDNAAVAVRQAARGIERARFSLAVQEKNVAASMNRQAAIDAAPDRATARDRTDALDALRRAQENRSTRRRSYLQRAILRDRNTTR